MRTNIHILICSFIMLLIHSQLVNAQNILYEEHFDTPGNWIGTKDYLKFKKGKMIISHSGTSNAYNAYEPKDENSASQYQGIRFSPTYCSGEVTAKWIKNNRKEGVEGGYGIKYFPYDFIVFPDGSFKIEKYNTSKKYFDLVYSSGGKPVEGINTGPAENKIKVVKKEMDIALYVNDKLIKHFNYDFKATNSQFVIFSAGGTEVEFDDYIIRSVPVFENEKRKTELSATCDLKNRNFEEIMFDGGMMPEADILKLPPEKQLLDFLSVYGLCMKINPVWMTNNTGFHESMIKIDSKSIGKIASTLPKSSAVIRDFTVVLAINPGTIESIYQTYGSKVTLGFKEFCRLGGGEFSDERLTNYWPYLVKREYLITDEGKQGTIYTFNRLYLPFNPDTSFNSIYMSPSFTVVFLIPQPENKVIQCTVDFEKSYAVQKPLDGDITVYNLFNSTEQKQYLDWLKAMFKSIRGAK